MTSQEQNVSGAPQGAKEYWWEKPLLLREQMTAEELARPYNPYYGTTTGAESQVEYVLSQVQPMLNDEPIEAVTTKLDRGMLQQRRAHASPEKFNNDNFQPLSVHPVFDIEQASSGLTAGLHDLSVWSRKRKFVLRPAFSLMESLCDNHDVLLFLVSYLTLTDIISLYAISKRFHYLWNANYVAHIRASLRTWAPNAEELFPWSCYKNLCIKDPCVRQKSKWEGKEHLVRTAYQDSRDVPSLRWLQMVVYREGVSYDILIQMAMKGLKCMPITSDAVKRIWFVLDLPLNAHRIALMRSTTYISNKVLHRMTGFFLKLDMFFTDPFGQPYPQHDPMDRLYVPDWQGQTFTGVELREYLLAERSLTPLWRVLRGWSPDPADPQIPMTRLDMLRLWARHKFSVPESTLEPIKKMSFMGVPWWKIGTARLERVGGLTHKYGDYADATVATAAPVLPIPGPDKIPVPILTAVSTTYKPETMHRPDELVMLEGIRRRLGLHRSWLVLTATGLHDGVGHMVAPMSEEEMNRVLLGNVIMPRARV